MLHSASGELVKAPDARVFLVERDPHVCRLVKHFLADAFEVEVFDDGYAALDRAREVPPTAVITEIMIPRLDGLALCRLLKSDPLTSHVPILVFSALAAAIRAQASGADAFLEKPIEKTRLVTALRSLTESRQHEPREQAAL